MNTFAVIVGVAIGMDVRCRAQEMAEGVTIPYLQATLSSTVPGEVSRLLVREGAVVEAGQVVVELERRREELAMARSKLLYESKAELESAQARRETVDADLAALRQVYKNTQSVSLDDVRRLELDAKVAKAQVDQFLMVEERERIDYELAIEELARRSIRAPWPGIVIRVDIEEGENCEPRQPLLTLVDVSRSYLVINVQAARSRQLKVGQTLQVEIHPAPSTPLIAGQVSYVSPVVDAGSGLGEVRVLFPNPGGRVLPGTVARLTLPALKP